MVAGVPDVPDVPDGQAFRGAGDGLPEQAPLGGRRLRLVLVAPFARYPKGTTRARVLPLARALAGHGHQVTVLIPPYDHPEESGERYTAGAAAVEALAVDRTVAEHSVRQAVVQPTLAAAVVRRALLLQPDVVHVFKPKAVSGLAQLFLWHLRRLRGGPAIALDTDDWEGDGGWNEYEAYPWWQKRACDWQERWGLGHADAVTAASRTLQAQAWSHRVPPARVAYLPNGLDPADYAGWEDADGSAARARFGLGDAPVVVLYTRFFEFEPARAVSVLERMVAAVPAVRLLVVGAGKFGQERQLEALARDRGLGQAVVVAGWQVPEAIPGLIGAGDVLLFPADDNLANRAKCSAKLLEALWLGRAVVADRVGQQAEYVRHEQTGLLSEPDDPGSMATAAVRLLRERSLARALGRAGRGQVLDEYNWPRLSRAAERAYGAALSLRGSAV